MSSKKTDMHKAIYLLPLLMIPQLLSAQQKYIPEIWPVDVYKNLEKIGFTTEKDLGSEYGNFWISTYTNGSIRYTVETESDVSTKVESIRATVFNFNLDRSESKQFFKYIGSILFLYNDKSQERLDDWIDQNFDNDGAKTSVGEVSVRIGAPSNIVRILKINY